MAYPTTTYTATPASVSTTYTATPASVSTTFTATPASASTTYTADHQSPAASDHCDYSQWADGGQNWLIKNVKDSVCRLCYAIDIYCDPTAWTLTP